MFSYIILHYKNINETIECLTSLYELSQDSHFIVVDNNTLSSNDEKLIKRFTNDIIKLDKNYGFVKANNKGINYAKKKYNSDFYVIINNDVIIKQKDFENNIINDYKKYKFDMLGPKIDSPTKESVNPFPAIKTKDELINEINKCKKLIKIYNNSFLTILLKTYIKIKSIFVKHKKLKNGDKLLFKVPLHGCGIIFSKEYIDKYKDAFYNETFLFHEEEFLFNRTIKDNLISIYDPDIEIYHKEGTSLKRENKKERLKKLFREKERLKSLELLEKEM